MLKYLKNHEATIFVFINLVFTMIMFLSALSLNCTAPDQGAHQGKVQKIMRVTTVREGLVYTRKWTLPAENDFVKVFLTFRGFQTLLIRFSTCMQFPFVQHDNTVKVSTIMSMILVKGLVHPNIEIMS